LFIANAKIVGSSASRDASRRLLEQFGSAYLGLLLFGPRDHCHVVITATALLLPLCCFSGRLRCLTAIDTTTMMMISYSSTVSFEVVAAPLRLFRL